MQQGDICHLIIEGINNEGEGVVRTGEERFVIFVPDALPGEEIDCRIVQKKKTYATGKVLKRYSSSPNRVTPKCKVFHKCGGCQLQHMSYDSQLKLKKKIVFDALVRIGGIDSPAVLDCVASPDEWGYRNKASVPVQSMGKDVFKSGFYQTRSHHIVPFDSCGVLLPTLDNKIRSVISAIKQAGFHGKQSNGSSSLQIKHIVARQTVFTDKSLCAVIGNRKLRKNEFIKLKKIFDTELDSFDVALYNENGSNGNFIWGERNTLLKGNVVISEKIGKYSFDFEASSFFQINTKQTLNLYEEASTIALEDAPSQILELYSGVGSLTAFLASGSANVTAVESWEPAAKYMLRNLKSNGLNNVCCYTGKAEDVVRSFFDDKYDVVVMDPPRGGCQPEVLAFLKKIRPKKIVYVSCNPATLARDIKKLDTDYYLEYAKPFDMFPQTGHVETVAVLVLR